MGKKKYDERIKGYTKKDGTTAYMFQVYLGVDPVTGKKRRTTKRGFETQKEASLALSRLEVDIAEKGLRTNEFKVDTYEELFDLWFEQYCNTVKVSTQEQIKYLFKKYINPELGGLRPDKITPAICQKMVNKWAKIYKNYSAMRIYTSKVFKYGILIEVLNTNPMDKIIMPKKIGKPDEEIGQFYSRDELQQFFSVLKQYKGWRKNGEYAIAFFRVLAFTGARKGEALALTWDDIDLELGTITFNKTLVKIGGKLITQPPKTKASYRTVSIDAETIKVLKRLKIIQNMNRLATGERTSKKHKIVFCIRDKYLDLAYPNQLLMHLYKHFPDLKKIKVHGFRHTHASLLFEAGLDVKDVQERLGHTDIHTTMNIYTHVSESRKEQTAEKFAAYVNF